MRWPIQQLITNRSETVDIDRYVDVGELIDRDKELREITKAHVKGRIDIDHRLATFQLFVTGTMVLPDSRTLADTEVSFEFEMNERFRLDGKDVPEDDETMHAPKNGYVDLLPLIKEHILLAIPMQVRGEDSDVEGLAPQEGTDWSVTTSNGQSPGEEEQKIDPRLADLAKFFEKDR